MPENNDDGRLKLKKFSYLISILVAFLAPMAFLARFFGKHVPKKPFLFASVTIALIGWIWSWIVSSNNWWTFGPEFLTGIQIIPHLPLEELLFYPLGGILCILIYTRVVAIPSMSNKSSAALYWCFLILGSLVFVSLAWWTRQVGPVYLCSQLIVYNLLCSLLLAPFVAKEINLPALSVPIVILSVVGFVWNYIGFKYGWWVYNATTQIKVSIVPIDDFNFFLFAPTSAVSIYVSYCKLFKSRQYEE